jgi:hypothetical protein
LSCECRKVRTRQTRAKKKEARIIGGPKMGPSQKPPNLAPFFWPRLHCPQLGFGSALGGYHNQGQTPRRSSIRLSQFIPAVLKETKEREYSVVSYRPFFLKKTDDSNTYLYNLRFLWVPNKWNLRFFESTKFWGAGGKPEWPVHLILEHFQHFGIGDYKQNQIPAQYWGLRFRVCKCRTLNHTFTIVKCKGTACIFAPDCPDTNWSCPDTSWSCPGHTLGWRAVVTSLDIKVGEYILPFYAIFNLVT